MGRREAERKKDNTGKRGGEYGSGERGMKKHGAEEHGGAPRYRTKNSVKKSSKGSKGASQRNKRRYRQYIPVPIIIMVVVMAAFFTPQIMFLVQDGFLHGRTELSRQDPMDVEALSSSYEKSVYRRMQNFAEGLALGDSFYVTSKNLAASGDPAELDEYIHSGYLYQDMLQYVLALNLIPLYGLDYEYTLSQWKQYVVYSDNYGKGINFILWYVEFVCIDDITVRLLADAETGTLYALKVQGCLLAELSEYVDRKYEELLDSGRLSELWLLCGSQFGVFSTDEELQGLITGQEEAESDIGHRESEAYPYDQEESFRAKWEAYGIANAVVDMQIIQEEEDYAAATAYIEGMVESDWENRLARLRLPYGTASLEIYMELGKWESEAKGWSYVYPDLTIGVRQLYEMIPEFL